MPRKYQHTQELMPQIKEMLSQGMTQRQIEEKLGLTGYRPVHALLKRERKKDIREYRNNEAESQPKHYKNTNTRTNG